MKKIYLFIIALCPLFAWGQNFELANTVKKETNGSAVAPSITVDASSLTWIHTTTGTASAPQTILVSATGLTSDLIISPAISNPGQVDFEISIDGGVTYTKAPTALAISPVDGVIDNVPVKIRIAATASWGPYTGFDLIFSSPGASAQRINVPGDVSATTADKPIVTIDLSGIIPFTAIYPASSAIQSFTVSGTNIGNGGIAFFCFSPYEISEDGGVSWAHDYSRGCSVFATAGTVTTTTMLLRIRANTPPGTANGGMLISSSAASDHSINLYGLVSTAAALPVKLESFAAVKEDNTVKLAWKSSEEINSTDYAVQRSSDGNNFTNIGDVAAKGVAASYAFTDANPLTGDNYYRLKPVDKDGKFTYSKVVKVNFTKLPAIHISPNPASSYLYISLENINSSVSLQLIDLNGKTVTQQIIAPGQTNKTISLSGMAKGLYSVKLVSMEKVITQKLLIQ